MKTPDDKLLIYDSTCPMCSAYSKAFVRHGLLNNRMAFSDLNDQPFISGIDLQRAKQEIPLVDLSTGKTIYGLDALILILAGRISLIGKIMQIRPLYWFMKRGYATVSFNRRIIIPAKKEKVMCDCSPDFNLKYRLVFIFFAICFSSLISWWFGVSLAAYFNLNGGGYKMLLIAGTGWLFQMLLAGCVMKHNRIDYFGHLSVIMITGVLLLVPGNILSMLTGFQYIIIPAASVCISSSVMLWQHIRRIKHLQLTQGWTLSWFLLLQLTALFWACIFYF